MVRCCKSYGTNQFPRRAINKASRNWENQEIQDAGKVSFFQSVQNDALSPVKLKKNGSWNGLCFFQTKFLLQFHWNTHRSSGWGYHKWKSRNPCRESLLHGFLSNHGKNENWAKTEKSDCSLQVLQLNWAQKAGGYAWIIWRNHRLPRKFQCSEVLGHKRGVVSVEKRLLGIGKGAGQGAIQGISRIKSIILIKNKSSE